MKDLIKNILRESFLTEAKKTFFRRVSLPYDYNSVKDFVGYETMWEHYNKHYKGYTTKLNEALSKRKNPSKDIEKIIRGIKNYDTFTRNNAGGYYNHSLFFRDYITPDKTELSDELKKKINKDFGSLDNFKRQINIDNKVLRFKQDLQLDFQKRLINSKIITPRGAEIAPNRKMFLNESASTG